MDGEFAEERSPRKRMKLSNDLPEIPHAPVPVSKDSSLSHQSRSAGRIQDASEDVQAMKEAEVGITEFVCPDLPGFTGILKKRYTDFIVNEILPSGKVLHLQSLTLPRFDSSSVCKTGSLATASTSTSDTIPDYKSRGEAIEPPGLPQHENEPGGNVSSKTVLASSGLETVAGSEFRLSGEDHELLEAYFGAEIAQSIIALHNRALSSSKAKAGDLKRVKSPIITDRNLRTKIHQAIRRIFSSRLESSTDNDGAMVISVVPSRCEGIGSSRTSGREGRKGKFGWNELGGEFLHFSIYKENKDTMEVVSYLARHMKMNAKQFQFAGTKDKRAATVQRASAYRVYADRLAAMNKGLRNAAVGDFEYQKQGLELGELSGNEFIITLRDCKFPGSEDGSDGSNNSSIARASELVSSSLRNLRERGYFNYFGLQRFGTFSTRTDAIGVKMLQDDLKGACESILHFNRESLVVALSPSTESLVSTDDMARAEAIHIFQTTGKVNRALDKLPKKFSAESNIIRHLGRVKNDYYGALQSIPRNLRLMYVHAYQSLVWNFAAGERWRLFGDQVVAGDLVLVDEFKDNTVKNSGAEVDVDGEPVIFPGVNDIAHTADDIFIRARALSAEEAASGLYTIFDVVLPLPGFDILYPANEMTDFYKRFMASEQGGGLDPFDMRRKWKDVSLSGSYRKLLSRPGPDYSFEVRRYSKDDQQFTQTDLEKLKGGTNGNAHSDPDQSKESEERANKVAVIIKFQLGPSQYATMALRELMKIGGVKTYKPEFGAGR